MRADDPEWTTKLHETFVSTLHSVGNPNGVDFSISEDTMQRRQASAIADGTMTVVGGLDKAPACLADVHDTMARLLGARQASDPADIVSDQIRRTAEGWRFSRREFVADG